MLSSLAAAVAVATSVLGLLVAVGQLTLGTRLRKYATFLSGAIENEKPGSAQRRVLESMYRDAVARLVGADAVPSWLLAVHGMVLVFGAYISGALGWGAAAFPSWLAIVLSAGLAVVIGAPAFAIGLRLASQDLRTRAAVERAYLRGNLPLSARRARVRLRRDAPGCRDLVAASVALVLLGFGTGLALGVGPRSQLPGWALDAAAIVAMLLAGVFLLATGSRPTALTDPRGFLVWLHPSRLTEPLVEAPADADERGVAEASSG